MSISWKRMIRLFKAREKRGFLSILFTSIFASLIVGIIVFILTTGYVARNFNREAPDVVPGENISDMLPRPQLVEAETDDNPSTVVQVAKNVSPAVVGISVLKVENRALFDTDVSEKWGVGTGVIVSPNGYIVTNHHVAGGKSERIVVSLSDGRNVDGVTLWSEPVMDLAIVKINEDGLIAAAIGNSDNIQVGETAVAIGNPLGLQFQRSVTSGVISALNRTISIETERGANYMEDLIQTDASINPGNSGGPLLNSKGEIIGINTVKVASAEAIGFAVPINAVAPVIKSFIEKGEFNEPYIGVFAYDKETIPFLNNIKVDNGIYVASADKKGPAYKAGIREGCIIETVDGRLIDTMIQLRAFIYSKNPGDIITVKYLPEGENEFKTVQIKLAEKKGDRLLTR